MHEIEQDVKDFHVIIAYVLFGLSFLQVVRLFAGACVNRSKREESRRGNPQAWLYGDPEGRQEGAQLPPRSPLLARLFLLSGAQRCGG